MIDDDNKLRQQIYNYKRKDKLYAMTDDDYETNLLPFLTFSSKEDCVEFYKMWFSIYDEVVDNWDTIQFQENGGLL